MNYSKRNPDFEKSLLLLHGYLALFLITIISLCVFKFYHHHEIFTTNVRDELLIMDNSDTNKLVEQELGEHFSYALSVSLVPLIVLLSLFLSRKYLVFYQQKNWQNFYLGISLLTFYLFFIALSILIYTIWLSYLAGNGSYAWQKTDLYGSSVGICFGLLLAYSAVLYGFFKQKKVEIFFKFTAVILSIFVTSFRLFNEGNLENLSYNFSPVFYPLVQLFLGKALLVDFKSLYGLHPYFLEPLLHLFGTNLAFISIIYASLFLISLLAIAFCLFANLENKLVALIGFIALLFIQNFANDIWPISTAIAFQYEPIRLFFPSLLLGFFTLFFKKPTVKKYFASIIFFSFAPLWNIDSGLPTFITLACVLGYDKWFITKKEQFGFKSVIKHFAQIFGIFAAVLAVFILMIKLRFGAWPHFDLAFYGQSAAFAFGYSLMPISHSSFWWIEILFYIAGALLVMQNFLNQKHSSQQDKFLIVPTLLGMGLFSYFVGRSCDSNLFHCGYPAVILAAIFADKFCGQFRKEDVIWKLSKPRTSNLLNVIPLLVISYLAIVFFLNIFTSDIIKENPFFNRYQQEELKKTSLEAKLEFMKKYVGESKEVRNDIIILDDYDEEYYYALKLRARSPNSFVNVRHIFYVSEIEELNQMMLDGKTKYVILSNSYFRRFLTSFSKKELQEIRNSLRKKYKILAESKIDWQNKVTIYSLK